MVSGLFLIPCGLGALLCGFVVGWGVRDLLALKDRRAARMADTEVRRLRQLTEGLAARVAAQSELLSRRAEGAP